ncbi:MAG: sulfotransferase family 2 domain-containing protein [Pseudomonadota bacterium]
MLIFLEKSLIVYAVPKTGSTALQAALHRHADISMQGAAKHITVGKVEKRLSSFLGSLTDTPLEGFAIIREPIEWLHSWYRYRRRADVPAERSTADLGFDDFVALYLSETPPPCAKLGKQSNFLKGSARSHPEHLFAHDHMDRAVDFLSERLDIEFALDWMNSSPEMELELSPENRARLRDHFAEDYRLYETALSHSLAFAPRR